VPGALLAQRFEPASHEPLAGEYVPHVVAWNLTRRCNLECAHCYISAGPAETAAAELGSAEFRRIAAEILAFNPAPLFILSGGEPLLRADLGDLVRFAAQRGATVVVGTNGTLLDEERIQELADAGVSGFAISVDALDAKQHDAFRHAPGSLAAATAALERLRRHRLDFIVQTTVTKRSKHQLGELAAWAAAQGAVCFNAYFLVATGRGARLSDLSPVEYEAALAELVALSREYLGRMMVRAKCAPHFMRHVHQSVPDSPILHYRTRCPCGTQYCRITPDGKLTPCPYIPLPAGDLRQRSFGDVWLRAPLLELLRTGELGGRCGRCEYRQLCGGCRARALAVQGDLLAEDPACAYQPRAGAPVLGPARDVTYGAPAEPAMPWTPEARRRLERIPSFVRGVVARRVEAYARRVGAEQVSLELMRDVRRELPVDFSRRLPFFARDD
jgi:radical SAM protein with 4Fe4S-binding SPASM domain